MTNDGERRVMLFHASGSRNLISQPKKNSQRRGRGEKNTYDVCSRTENQKAMRTFETKRQTCLAVGALLSDVTTGRWVRGTNIQH